MWFDLDRKIGHAAGFAFSFLLVHGWDWRVRTCLLDARAVSNDVDLVLGN